MERLSVVSAGNVRRPWDENHLDVSDLRPVEDPAQAWNVLTVGAFTERDSMADAPREFAGWTPLAARGELSPFSRTSMTYSKPWPTKPDVVLEGGNLARSPQGQDLDTPDNLQILIANASVGSTRPPTPTGSTEKSITPSSWGQPAESACPPPALKIQTNPTNPKDQHHNRSVD